VEDLAERGVRMEIKNSRNGKYWKGGRFTDPLGYVRILMPKHPRAWKSGYIHEHILIMEKILGRPILSTEHIHHIDDNRSNNSPGNLMLFRTKGMHKSYHERLKAFKECGHYDWRKCRFCHIYDNPKNLVFSGSRCVNHRSCAAEYHKGNYVPVRYKNNLEFKQAVCELAKIL
jgi:hypothetical protein